MASKVDHALLVECGRDLESLDLMYIMQESAEGVTSANVAYFTMNPDKVNGPVPEYENPRPGKIDGKWVADQKIALAEVIDQRGKATCIEWCCFMAAVFRYRDGIAAKCVLIPVWGALKRPIPYRYHAVVRLPNGEFFDATAQLPGYGSEEPWWKVSGHCCEDCAMGSTGYKHEPCQACASGACSF